MFALATVPGRDSLPKDEFLRRFGFMPQHFDLLIDLAFADWHQRHDDARALAVKAIWGLGTINDLSAKRGLEHLATAANTIVADAATHQLERRHG